MPKNMVPDPRWFNRNRTKFEDWWREMRLFLKSNRVIETNNKITVILAYLREGVADIYAQKKLNELDKEFVKEIKTTFSNKTKTADAEQKIEIFKQGKQNIVNFIIEFNTLAIKMDTDELYIIFLLKKNVQQDIIKIILGYLSIAILESLKKQKVVITSVGQEYESTEGYQDYKTGTGTTYSG